MPILSISSVPIDIRTIPAFSVDLGFSEDDSSVGLCSNPEGCSDSPLRFAEAIENINRHLSALAKDGRSRALLLIEAPLTLALTEAGNPCHRQIELQRNYERGSAPRSPKGWYYQAGANLSLGSTLFLRRLVVPDGFELLLVEGFFCSISPDELHASHQFVAKQLLDDMLAHPGKSLITPRPEVEGGTVQLLPGLESIVKGIPGILLRPGLKPSISE